MPPAAPSRASARRRRIVAVGVIAVLAGGAFVALRFLRDRTPERVANFRAMAAERARAADPRAAEALLRRAAEADPSNAQVQFDLGLVLVALDRAEEAERAFRAATAATPGIPDAALEAARLAAARGDLAAAMSVLDAAIARDAGFARAHATRAWLRLRAGDLEAALADFDALTEIAPADPRPPLIAGYLAAAIADARFDDALAALAEQRFVQARTRAAAAGDAGALAWAKLAQHDAAGALAALDAAAAPQESAAPAASADAQPAAILRAVAMTALGEPYGAERVVRDALGTTPSTAAAAPRRAEITAALASLLCTQDRAAAAGALLTRPGDAPPSGDAEAWAAVAVGRAAAAGWTPGFLASRVLSSPLPPESPVAVTLWAGIRALPSGSDGGAAAPIAAIAWRAAVTGPQTLAVIARGDSGEAAARFMQDVTRLESNPATYDVARLWRAGLDLAHGDPAAALARLEEGFAAPGTARRAALLRSVALVGAGRLDDAVAEVGQVKIPARLSGLEAVRTAVRVRAAGSRERILAALGPGGAAAVRDAAVAANGSAALAVARGGGPESPEERLLGARVALAGLRCALAREVADALAGNPRWGAAAAALRRDADEVGGFLLEQSARRDPKDPAALEAAASDLDQAGLVGHALALRREAAAQFPDLPHRIAHAACAARAGRIAEARAVLGAADGADRGAAQLALAEIELVLGRDARAAALALSVLAAGTERGAADGAPGGAALVTGASRILASIPRGRSGGASPAGLGDSIRAAFAGRGADSTGALLAAVADGDAARATDALRGADLAPEDVALAAVRSLEDAGDLRGASARVAADLQGGLTAWSSSQVMRNVARRLSAAASERYLVEVATRRDAAPPPMLLPELASVVSVAHAWRAVPEPEVMSLVRSLRDAAPRSAFPDSLLGAWHSLGGRFADSARSYAAAAEFEPGDVGLLAHRVGALVADGRQRDARDLCRAWTSRWGAKADALVLLAAIECVCSDGPAGERAARLALDAEPSHVGALRILARALPAPRRSPEMTPVLIRAAAAPGLDAAETIEIAGLLADAGAVEPAARLLSTLPSGEPSLGARFVAARLAAARGESAEAERLLEAEIAAWPAQPHAWFLLARTIGASHGPAAARARIAEIHDGRPQPAAQLTALAMIDSATGDLVSAEKNYRAALAVDPGFMLAANDLAYLLSERLRRPAEAVTVLEPFAALAERDPNVADTRGWALHLAGQSARALPDLRRAAAGAPASREIGMHLATVLDALGFREEAARELERASRL